MSVQTTLNVESYVRCITHRSHKSKTQRINDVLDETTTTIPPETHTSYKTVDNKDREVGDVIDNYIHDIDNGIKLTTGLIVVPVVFHICSAHYDFSKLADDIDFTINRLNEDFNMKNADFDMGRGRYIGDTNTSIYDDYVSRSYSLNVSFFKKDIKIVNLDTVQTINREQMDKTIKSASRPIDPVSVLNLYVVDFDKNGTNMILGYSRFPWELSEMDGVDRDGVCVSRLVFGKSAQIKQYNKNRTVTHEVGHWFGLYHNFQSTANQNGGVIDQDTFLKDDLCKDTPSQGSYTLPGDPYYNNTWQTSKQIDTDVVVKHMHMNFMDYTDDEYMFMFTKDQCYRMRAMCQIYRKGILIENITPGDTTNGTTTSSTTTSSTTTSSTTTSSTTSSTTTSSTTSSTTTSTTTTIKPPSTTLAPSTTIKTDLNIPPQLIELIKNVNMRKPKPERENCSCHVCTDIHGPERKHRRVKRSHNETKDGHKKIKKLIKTLEGL